MPTPSSLPESTRSPHRNGHSFPADRSASPPAGRATKPSFLAPFLGAFAAVIVLVILGAMIFFGMSLFRSSPSSPAASTTATTTPQTNFKSKNPLDDAALWKLGTEPSKPLEGSEPSDVSWWTRTFYLPKTDTVSSYLKNQGLDVAQIEPSHYEDTADGRTITYQIHAEVPSRLERLQKIAWHPTGPDQMRFTRVLVLNDGMPAGTEWNTQEPIVAAEAGTKLNFAWQVHWDKTYNEVTTDRLPYPDNVFTEQQVAQYESQAGATVSQLQNEIDQINTQVQAQVDSQLGQVASNPPRPDLLSSKWGGDGSGEPTKSAERIGGGTAAGAAGGAAIGAGAGDAGLGAGIGAGVGLLGGLIYDGVSKSNDRKRWERHVEAVNSERLDEWHTSVKALDQQRNQINQDGLTEKNRQLDALANQIAAAHGHLDNVTPIQAAPVEPNVESTQAQPPTSEQPSGPMVTLGKTASGDPIVGVSPLATGPIPTGAAVIVPSSAPEGQTIGNIQVTYPNGQTKMLTQDGNCSQPHISPIGDIGWVYTVGNEPKYGRLKNMIEVRYRDGSTKTFESNALFVEDWAFTDWDRGLVIRSMHHHGPNSYIRYDLKTGDVTDHLDDSGNENPVPRWARPVQDPSDP